jgi:hypothetical protein
MNIIHSKLHTFYFLISFDEDCQIYCVCNFCSAQTCSQVSCKLCLPFCGAQTFGWVTLKLCGTQQFYRISGKMCVPSVGLNPLICFQVPFSQNSHKMHFVSKSWWYLSFPRFVILWFIKLYIVNLKHFYIKWLKVTHSVAWVCFALNFYSDEHMPSLI